MTMKRALAIAAGVVLVVVTVLLHTPAKDWLWTHPWSHSFIVVVPSIALAVIALIELKHSDDANVLRGQANTLRREANDLGRENARLNEALDAERNRNLQQIADNTKPPTTQAERHTSILQRHLGKMVSVSEGMVNWSSTPEIAEVKDEIVTLFTPKGFSSSSSWCVQVHCKDLEVVEIAQGSCPLRIRVLKRYGPDVSLGEITKWEERNQPPAAVPAFHKGNMAWHASYGEGSSFAL